MAPEAGFEPADLYRSSAFKAYAFIRSAIPANEKPSISGRLLYITILAWFFLSTVDAFVNRQPLELFPMRKEVIFVSIQLMMLVLLLVIFGIKALINLRRYSEIRNLRKRFENALKDPHKTFSPYKITAISLFKAAGIKDPKLPYSLPVGYGHFANGTTSVFENLALKNQFIAQYGFQFFDEAEGVFRHRMIEAINPIYWVETLAFLPKCLVEHLGFSSNNISTKLLQITYWIIVSMVVLFKEDLIMFLQSWLSSFLK